MIDLFIRIHKLINFYTGLIYYIVNLNEDYVQGVGYSGNLGTLEIENGDSELGIRIGDLNWVLELRIGY